MKFKVGDKVRVVTVRDERKNKYLDTILTVEKVNSQPYFTKEEHYSLGEDYVFFPDELELAPFTKADLKDGMVVECHNGDRYLVVNDRLINHEGWLRISNFSNNLSSDSVEFTIDKVYETIGYNFQTLFNDGKLTLIWEREELAKKMTVEEIEKELGYKVEIISKEN